MMSVKRRDSKGRVLRNGETQLENGKYVYRYTDIFGKRVSLYSWRLVETDKMPDGKRSTVPLRVQEDSVQYDIFDGICSSDKTTFDMEFNKFIRMKNKIKESTKANYIYYYNLYVKKFLGSKILKNFSFSLVKEFYILLLDDGLSIGTIKIIDSIVSQVFKLAVRDNIVRTNPCSGIITELDGKDSKKVHALTIPQQRNFVDYLECEPKWKYLYLFLLGTGCRIGEALALQWSDCDFVKGVIYICKTLKYGRRISGNYEYYITSTKTECGDRVVPMFNSIRRLLIELSSMKRKTNTEIDGYNDFIFLNGKSNPINPSVADVALSRIVKNANKAGYGIPKISCHNLRHTFCTRLCEANVNIKVIQEVMGHSKISITMDIYCEATQEFKLESIKSISTDILVPV